MVSVWGLFDSAAVVDVAPLTPAVMPLAVRMLRNACITFALGSCTR
jgi:hypothetical protein